MKPFHQILSTLLCLVLTAPVARAGRGTPDPLLKQFEEGYGVVAAEVISAEKPPDSTDTSVDGTYGVTFRAIKVVADTVRRHPRLGLKAGDSFDVMLSVGYGCPVERIGEWDAKGNPVGEWKPFPAGRRFYLTLRPSNFGTFEHAHGADAARQLARFDERSDARFARLRAVADMPLDRRWDETLSIAGNSKEDHDLRQQALQYFARYFVANGLPGEEYVARARERLWAMWRGPQSAFADDDLFQLLDRALAKFAWADFGTSAERRQKWFDRIFEPPAPGAAHDPARLKRRRDLTYMLIHMARDDRTAIAARLVAELRGDKWPPTFRNHLAGLLLQIDLETVYPEPEWEPELQKAFARLALELTDPQDFRQLAGMLRHAVTAEIKPSYQPGARRHFILNESTSTALAGRIAPLRAQATADDADQSAIAARELGEALAAQRAGDPKPK